MKRRSSDFSIIPVDPTAPKKRRHNSLDTHGQVLAFTDMISDASDSPRSLPTHDENRTLSSPWTPITHPLWNWIPSTPAQTSSGSDFSPFSSSSAPSTRTSDNSNDDYLLSNSAARDPFGTYLPPPLPLESPPLLLELRRTAGHSTLQTSDMRAYKSPGNPPAAQSAWKGCKEIVLQAFSDAGKSPLDLILDILDPTQLEYENYRSRWFSPACNKLSLLLDRMFAHPKGHDLVLCWMQPHVLDSVCSTVSSEMDLVVKKFSLPSVEHITPDFINGWTLETVVEPATQLCPSLLRVLEAAAQTTEAKQKNKIKSPKTVSVTVIFVCSSCANYGKNVYLVLQYNCFSARIPTVKPLPQVPVHLWSFSLEHRVIKENDRCAISLQLNDFTRQHSKAPVSPKPKMYRSCKGSCDVSAYVLL